MSWSAYIITLLFCLCYFLHCLYLSFTRSRRHRTFFNGQHVWVIGASRGIGAAIAKQLAHHGAIVSVSSRTTEALEALASHPRVFAVALDISLGHTAIAAAHKEVIAAAGAPVNIVIANAGVNHGARPFDKVTPQESDAIISTNFRGVVHCFREVLSNMRTARRGTLCAVSSLTAYRGVPGASVYGATKAAITNFCQSLATELLGSGVNVVCVHPGFVDTSAIRDLSHPKPFLVSAERAAELTLDGIVNSKLHCAFPWAMEHIVMKFSMIVPSPLYEYILHLTSN